MPSDARPPYYEDHPGHTFLQHSCRAKRGLLTTRTILGHTPSTILPSEARPPYYEDHTRAHALNILAERSEASLLRGPYPGTLPQHSCRAKRGLLTTRTIPGHTPLTFLPSEARPPYYENHTRAHIPSALLPSEARPPYYENHTRAHSLNILARAKRGLLTMRTIPGHTPSTFLPSEARPPYYEDHTRLTATIASHF